MYLLNNIKSFKKIKKYKVKFIFNKNVELFI